VIEKGGRSDRTRCVSSKWRKKLARSRKGGTCSDPSGTGGVRWLLEERDYRKIVEGKALAAQDKKEARK